MVKTMIQAVLHTNDEETLDILLLRAASMVREESEAVECFLELDEGLQCLSRDDEMEFRKTQKKMKKQERRNP